MSSTRARSSRPSSAGPTLQQVADAAGVSLATASRVLHGSGGRRVAQALADRVQQAASGLRYVAHAPAQSLARSRSTVVGLLVHDIADPYFAAIAAGAMQVARENDLMVLVASTFRDQELESDYLDRLRAQRARAVVLAGSAFLDSTLDSELAAFVSSGGRAVAIGAQPSTVDTVAPDHHGGGRLVAEHLLSLGHRRIGVITGPSTLVTVAERLAGFHSLVSAAPRAESDFTRAGGHQAMRDLLRDHPDLTAVFALNDLMAAGALAALHEAGLPCPARISVVGFDDLPVATDLTPALTTIRLDLTAIGAAAMGLVLDEPASAPRVVPAPATLVLRSSTAAPRPS